MMHSKCRMCSLSINFETGVSSSSWQFFWVYPSLQNIARENGELDVLASITRTLLPNLGFIAFSASVYIKGYIIRQLDFKWVINSHDWRKTNIWIELYFAFSRKINFKTALFVYTANICIWSTEEEHFFCVIFEKIHGFTCILKYIKKSAINTHFKCNFIAVYLCKFYTWRNVISTLE